MNYRFNLSVKMDDLDLENLTSKCRCCLSFLEHGVHHREFTETQAQNFQLLTQIELHKSTILSNKFCTSCEMEIERFVKFRSDAIELQQKLLDLISHTVDTKTAIDFVTVDIKEEPADIKDCSVFIQKLDYEAIKAEVIKNFKTEPFHDHDPQTDSSDEGTSLKLLKTIKKEQGEIHDKRAKLRKNKKTERRRYATKIPSECSVCKAQFRNISDRNKHIRTNHPDEVISQVFSCDLCSYQHITKRRLYHHIRGTHLSKRQTFLCSQCAFQTYDNPRLQLHIKVKHDHILDHKCQHCEKSYGSKGLLNAHLRATHEGVRPIVKPAECPECKRLLTSERNLKEHMAKIHPKTDPTFLCHFCTKKFYTEKSLDSHINNAHSDKEFVCERGCGVKCKRKSSLIKHIRRHHPEVFIPINVDSCNY